jgi:hypothetical protein
MSALTPAERLEAAARARTELAKARAAKAAAAETAALADAEERALADDLAFAEAEDAHGAGKIARVETALGAVIVKRPSQPAYRKFQDSAKATTLEFEKLVRPCLVYPTDAALDRILEEQPGVLAELATAVARLAGTRIESNSGK